MAIPPAINEVLFISCDFYSVLIDTRDFKQPDHVCKQTVHEYMRRTVWTNQVTTNRWAESRHIKTTSLTTSSIERQKLVTFFNFDSTKRPVFCRKLVVKLINQLLNLLADIQDIL